MAEFGIPLADLGEFVRNVLPATQLSHPSVLNIMRCYQASLAFHCIHRQKKQHAAGSIYGPADEVWYRYSQLMPVTPELGFEGGSITISPSKQYVHSPTNFFRAPSYNLTCKPL